MTDHSSRSRSWYSTSRFFTVSALPAGGIGALCVWAGATITGIVFIAVAVTLVFLGAEFMDISRRHRDIAIIAIDNRDIYPELSTRQQVRMARRQYRRYGRGG